MHCLPSLLGCPRCPTHVQGRRPLHGSSRCMVAHAAATVHHFQQQGLSPTASLILNFARLAPSGFQSRGCVQKISHFFLYLGGAAITTPASASPHVLHSCSPDSMGTLSHTTSGSQQQELGSGRAESTVGEGSAESSTSLGHHHWLAAWTTVTASQFRLEEFAPAFDSFAIHLPSKEWAA